MDNATPLKKIKKPVNKFLLIGSIVLLFLIFIISSVYEPSTTKPKAVDTSTCSSDVNTGNAKTCRGQAVGHHVTECGWTSSGRSCQANSSGTEGLICENNGKTGSDDKVWCNSNCFSNPTRCSDGTPAGDQGVTVCGDSCIKWICPNGDTNTDNECDARDSGASSQRFQGVGCPGVTCGDDCCQIDFTLGEVICHPPNNKEIKLVCPAPTTPEISNTPTPTPTPEISNTPTPTLPIISNTPTPTPTIPVLTSTPGPTVTPIPVPCGTKDCDNNTNPCRSGYICVQATDGSNYCSSPDFATACKANPSFNSCCTAPGEPTATPTTASTVAPTKTASVPSVGTTPWGIIGIIGTIIFIGLLL